MISASVSKAAQIRELEKGLAYQLRLIFRLPKVLTTDTDGAISNLRTDAVPVLVTGPPQTSVVRKSSSSCSLQCVGDGPMFRYIVSNMRRDNSEIIDNSGEDNV